MGLSEVFWVAFITTVSGVIIKLASMAYKSKCTDVKLCCLQIKRDVITEEKENEFELTHSRSKSNLEKI
jgi:hypothetical protein